MRHKGIITHWNDEKGFGFITPEDSSDKVFIHANSLTRQQARPQLSDVVTYELAVNGKQKPYAIQIRCEESPVKFSALNLRHKGTITHWNDEKGFGFVTPDEGSERIFLHMNALATGQPRPQIFGIVTYEIGADSQRRPCAINVQYRGYRLGFSFLNLYFLGSIAFFAALFWMAVNSIIPWWVFIGYVGTSFLTILEYIWDKYKARRGKWRTSEATLHTLELLGGWPGALIAQGSLRHKNRKVSFQVQFWVIVAAHLSFWAWFLIQRPMWLTWLFK